ncbi:MAG: hypothetical protein M1837_003088 [Sclerophora amabilis]|nr:MAG: hypothetical protein M1837_003088 [Sclerophora amabilis]
MPSTDDNGVTAKPLDLDSAENMTMVALTAIALYNVVELTTQIFVTFKRRRGLYFWSLLVSTWGVAFHAIGFTFKYFKPSIPWQFSVIVITIGWYSMVTGQSIVLYSRLHLVLRDHKIRRYILIMIITNAIIFHIPTTVLTFGSNSPNPEPFAHVYTVMEKIQMTGFCIQEGIISGVYVWATLKIFTPITHSPKRTVMMHLIYVNLIIIAMDAVLLAVEYTGMYNIETTLKPMVYSIKLKLEFTVLNQLMRFTSSSVQDATNSNSLRNISFHDARKVRRGSTGNARSNVFNEDSGNVTSSRCTVGRKTEKVPDLEPNVIVKMQQIDVSSEPESEFTSNKSSSKSVFNSTTIVTGGNEDAKEERPLGATLLRSHADPYAAQHRGSIEDFGTYDTRSSTDAETDAYHRCLEGTPSVLRDVPRANTAAPRSNHAIDNFGRPVGD